MQPGPWHSVEHEEAHEGSFLQVSGVVPETAKVQIHHDYGGRAQKKVYCGLNG